MPDGAGRQDGGATIRAEHAGALWYDGPGFRGIEDVKFPRARGRRDGVHVSHEQDPVAAVPGA
jgi:hypothetical protein